MSIRVLIPALLISLAGVASVASAQGAPAQAQPATSAKTAAPQLTAAQKAALQKRNQVLGQYAVEIAEMIDNGKVGTVWDDASEVAKKSVTRKEFVDAITSARAKLGKATSRKVAAITTIESKGGKLPAGYYVNVNFATEFGKGSKPTRELVSFHLDNDKKWRLSGYHVY